MASDTNGCPVYGCRWWRWWWYLDDVICVSESPEQHLNYFRTVFEKLKEANLKLSSSKCNFFKSEVQYLWFIFSVEGVKSDPKKTAIVRNYFTPTKVKELKQFLGLTNYFRRYIKDYASTCQPLYRLLQKDINFVCTKAAENSFQISKSCTL